MELEAHEIARKPVYGTPSPTTTQPGRHEREPSLSTVLSTKAGAAADPNTQGGQDFMPFKDKQSSYQNMASANDAPTFSPFPKVKGDNVPPSDEEKEEILYNARQHVLHSNNVSMQLSWARDSLNFVEIAAEAHMRDNNGVMVRPQTPKVEHELRVDATNIVEYLARQNHPEALFMQAKWQEFGKFGYRLDKRSAYDGYKRAADQGWGRAEYRIGMLYENSNEFTKAIKHYGGGEKMKDSAAQYRLGMMTLLGQHGQPKDFQRGLELINKAADAADEDAPQGAYVFGMLIARDLPDISIPEGTLPYNLNTARQYIEKAAYLGFAKAQLKMGQAYELCQLGCDFNPAYSLHYYGLAARQGQPEAALGVSRWFLFGYEGVFNKNEQLAFKYAQQAADAKLGTGEFAMGYYHEIGIHVQKDVREAKAWYQKAADHGNKDAIGRLESLDQERTLTKKDHETTALGRIKSQHGSQRGKRPDRFKQPQQMPTLVESAPGTPVDNAPPPLPKNSPHISPRHQPTIVEDHVDFPDPAYGSRPPAFTVNLDHNNLAMRPKSAAPYPEDDRPPPLNLMRPRSAAPYPDDDVLAGQKPPLSPHYNPTIRPSAGAGPAADRPMSAFGVRPLSSGRGAPGDVPGGGVRASQSASSLSPHVPAGQQPPRGRIASAGWEPQVPAGYRQPSPGPSRQEYPYRQASPQRQSQQPPQQPVYDAGPRLPVGAAAAASVGTSSGPVGDPTRNRLTKNNPNPVKQATGPPSQFPMTGYGAPSSTASLPSQAGAQPGRDYGPRVSSRPVSDAYDRYGAAPLPSNPRPSTAVPSGRPERLDSLPPVANHSRLPSGGRPGVPLKDRPVDYGDAGRSSAPPAQGRPTPQVNSPAPSTASTTAAHGGPGRHGKKQEAHPDGKSMGQGPSTFEEMGIPQGKGDDDCVSILTS